MVREKTKWECCNSGSKGGKGTVMRRSLEAEEFGGRRGVSRGLMVKVFKVFHSVLLSVEVKG